MGLLAAVTCALLLPGGENAWDGKSYAIHEWGTFTSVQGSTGVRLDGLVHDTHDLPAFVHDATRDGALSGASPKMETPVVYFYSPTAWHLMLSVEFPRGRITHWYPRATNVNSVWRARQLAPSADALATVPLADGSIAWGGQGELTVLAAGEARALPPVGGDDPWRFAREVAANAIEVRHLTATDVDSMLECERFLFYRGLGDFELPLVAKVAWEHASERAYRVSLRLDNARPDEPATRLVLIYVGEHGAGFRELPDVSDALDVGPIAIPLEPIDRAMSALVDLVAARLATTGLYDDEALAMARTWAASWFGEPGLRLLYVLSRARVDRELPLAILGDHGVAPENLVRTFVARTEILSPRFERHLAGVATALAADDPSAPLAIDAWGRLAIPYLRRARELTSDARIRERIDREVARRAMKR